MEDISKYLPIKMWFARWFQTISTNYAKRLGLTFYRNVYGDEINIRNCRSLWLDKKGRIYKGLALFDPPEGLVKTETKDFEWEDDMKLFDKKIEVAVPQPEPEESHIETEIECLSRRLRNNAELLINPHMYERVRMNLIEIAEQLVTIQRKKQ